MFFSFIILISVKCKHDSLQKIINFSKFHQTCKSGHVIGFILKNVKQPTIELLFSFVFQSDGTVDQRDISRGHHNFLWENTFSTLTLSWTFMDPTSREIRFRINNAIFWSKLRTSRSIVKFFLLETEIFRFISSNCCSARSNQKTRQRKQRKHTNSHFISISFVLFLNLKDQSIDIWSSCHSLSLSVSPQHTQHTHRKRQRETKLQKKPKISHKFSTKR